MTYEQLLSRLFSLQDTQYRAFHARLLKNDNIRLIGVRVPDLRKLARELKGEVDEILAFPDGYYEVTFLKCLLVGNLSFPAFCERVEKVVPLLDNWATCDSFKAPCIQGKEEAFLPYVLRFLASEREFTVRYGLVTLLTYYQKEEYLSLIFESVKNCNHGKYYVMMASAWLIAEVLVRFFEEGVRFLREESLPANVHNRAIQKACESFRLSKEQKNTLRMLKIQN